MRDGPDWGPCFLEMLCAGEEIRNELETKIFAPGINSYTIPRLPSAQPWLH